MKRELHLYGDPVLRTAAQPVDEVDGDIRRLIRDMIETMHAEDGIGLAAQQVGDTRAVCVVDVPARADLGADGARFNPSVGMPLALINPRIVAASDETECADEGCLSFPDISAPVERPAEIDVAFTDADGIPREAHLRGLVARAVQHEMDHLAGRLIVDHMSPVRKVALSGRLKRLRRKTREALLQPA